MYLASSDENISPDSYMKRRKILRYVMIAMQLSFASFQILLIVEVSLDDYVYVYTDI
jgi:hypothetical protein